MIIHIRQQIEEIKDNELEQKKTLQQGGCTAIQSSITPWNIGNIYKTKIYDSPARKMERLFNVLPSEIKKKPKWNKHRSL